MHIHILGICGTFMGSLAILARQLGHKVTGCDQAVYPPMSTQLQQQGIDLIEGFDVDQLAVGADLYVVGNAMSRGNALVEAILNERLPYTSGPEFLSRHLLEKCWVLAVAGTHGKTTTSSMLAWILEYAGMSPGFLIGGIPGNFGVSARIGDTPFFVIEADEYDTAFFDKRSKFVHYHPRTLIMNNLEYDHADIFDSLAAIQTQFHHLVRIVPGEGQIIYPESDEALAQVLNQGCWSEIKMFGGASVDGEREGESNGARWRKLSDDGSEFELEIDGEKALVNWNHSGDHNVANAMAASIAARHVGVTLANSAAALCEFDGVKRRMELRAQVDNVLVYDDFAHHPTAIASTLSGLRKKVGSEKILAIIEPRSNTMKLGIHKETLIGSARVADRVLWSNISSLDWLVKAVEREQISTGNDAQHDVEDSLEKIMSAGLACIYNWQEEAQTSVHKGMGESPRIHVVIMSNGGFGNIHQKLIAALEQGHE